MANHGDEDAAVHSGRRCAAAWLAAMAKKKPFKSKKRASAEDEEEEEHVPEPGFNDEDYEGAIAFPGGEDDEEIFGVITDIEGVGDKAEASVYFGSVGEKRLLLSWAPLEKI